MNSSNVKSALDGTKSPLWEKDSDDSSIEEDDISDDDLKLSNTSCVCLYVFVRH